MTANKCDRCGKFYEEYKGINGVAKIHNYNSSDRSLFETYNFNKTYDLCPDCLESFNKWIRGETE